MAPQVTVNVTELLVRPDAVTAKMLCGPAVMGIAAQAPGGSPTQDPEEGIGHTMVVSLPPNVPGYRPPPKLIAFTLVSPVPVIVTFAPTGPAAGWMDVMTGVDAGGGVGEAVPQADAAVRRRSTQARSSVRIGAPKA
jgi:hypothetical protein